MTTEKEDYEEEDYEEESDGFILSFDEEGKEAKLTSKKDYENNIEKQQEIIMEFLEENVELFNRFLKKKGITEEEFNGEKTMTTKEQFYLNGFDSQRELRVQIQGCQHDNHVQQVVYSTYHDALTQICFTCKIIRTTLKGNKDDN